jgi:uncharacterized protein (DUF58 family)
MTWRKFSYYGLLAFNLLALMYSGSVIFAWLVIFQSAIFLLAVLNIVLSLRFLDLSQSMPKSNVAKGDRSVLTIEVKNRLPFPCAHLTLFYLTMERLLDGKTNKLSVSLMPFGKDSILKEMLFPYRGVYRLGFTELEASDLFGLLTVRLRAGSLPCAGEMQVIVYPRIHELRERAPALEPSSTKTKVDLDTTGSDLQIRERENTLIFGKTVSDMTVATARKPVLKAARAPDPPSTPPVISAAPPVRKTILVADCTAHAHIGEAAYLHEDAVAECAAALCRHYTAKAVPFRLEICGETREELVGSTASDFSAMYEKLARMRFGGNTDLNTALAESIDEDTGRVIVIASRHKFNMTETLAGCARRGVSVILVLVLDTPEFDETIMNLLGDFSLHGINTITLLPGEDFAYRLGAVL